jgi:excisionase family DNA binding protein
MWDTYPGGLTTPDRVQVRWRGDTVERERLMTPGEVAALFRVDPKTVTRWAASGRISSIRTPGGHRRFRESEVQALLRGEIDDDLENLMLQGAAVAGRMR